jgi:hypothetical protein
MKTVIISKMCEENAGLHNAKVCRTTQFLFVRSEVLTAVKMRIVDFWVVIPYSLAGVEVLL